MQNGCDSDLIKLLTFKSQRLGLTHCENTHIDNMSEGIFINRFELSQHMNWIYTERKTANEGLNQFVHSSDIDRFVIRNLAVHILNITELIISNRAEN